MKQFEHPSPDARYARSGADSCNRLRSWAPDFATRIRGWVGQAALILFLALFCALPANAHTRSQSQSRWSVDGDAIEARIEADAVDATRLYALGGEAPLQAMFAAEVSETITISANGEACTPGGAPRPIAGEAGRVIVSLRFTCPQGVLARGPITIESRLFHAVAPSHLHFAVLGDGQGRTAEAVLTAPNPRATLQFRAAAAESFWGALARFLPIGASHVWSGLDHVAFVLALLLLAAGNWRATLFAVAGFTLGHTLTLALAATGILRPDGTAIEALIGFTIAFVALQSGEGGPARMRMWSAPIAALLALTGAASTLQLAPLSPLIWFGLAAFVYAYARGIPRGAGWLAAIFGLIHGCGFAGGLTALDLPQPRLIASLLGFNIGVELGQMLVIGAALLLVGAARPLPWRTADAAHIAGAALFGLGFYWFVDRLAG